MPQYCIHTAVVPNPAIPAQFGTSGELHIEGDKIVVASALSAKAMASVKSAGQVGGLLAGGLMGAGLDGVVRGHQFGGQFEIDPTVSLCRYDSGRCLLCFTLPDGVHVAVTPVQGGIRRLPPKEFEALIGTLRPLFEDRMIETPINKWALQRKISCGLLVSLIVVFGLLIVLGILTG